MSIEFCPRCLSEWVADMDDQHAFNLVAAADPTKAPRHQDATDAEWWAWVMEGGRE